MVTGLRTSSTRHDGALRANAILATRQIAGEPPPGRELRDRLIRDPMRNFRPVAGRMSPNARNDGVVLAHRRRARIVRTRVEVQGTDRGRRRAGAGLVRAQLGLALRRAPCSAR